MTNATPTILVPSPDVGPAHGEDIRGVKPPVLIPSVWTWLGPLLIGLGMALATWLVCRAWRRWRRRVRAAPAIVVSPEVRARAKLHGAIELIGQPKPFCIAISQALRVYLEEQFQWRAPERTTEEFLEELQSSPRLSLRQKGSLGDFLVRCDLVKFARHEPGETTLRELLDAALRLVDETAGVTPEVAAGIDPGSTASGMVR